MDSYTITISPNDDSGNSTTLVVNTSDGQVRITDVRLHAPGGLIGGQLPTIDFGLLLSAVAASPVDQAVIEAAPAPEHVPAQAEEKAQAVTPEPADVIVEAPPAAAAPRPRRARRTAVPAPEPAPRPTTRRAPAAKKAAGTATKTSAKRAGRGSTSGKKQADKDAGTSATAGGRAYRRMPEDFAAVFQQAGTSAALADHYGVPRHTAQGWVRRLKATNAAANG